jgi:hypothetical protein
MAKNQLGNTDNFARVITAADGTGIIEVLRCEDFFRSYVEALENTYELGYNFYLEAFSGAAYLPSIAEAPFPEIFPEMNGAEKTAVLIKLEKDYPYIGVQFHCKKGETGEWIDLSTTKIQNKGTEITYPWTIPYLTINELKILGKSDRLGISIKNYGHGVLGVGDYINVKGDFRFHLDLVAKPSRVIGAGIPYGINISDNIPIKFRVANPHRAILYATNWGNAPVWVAGDDSVAIGSGIYLAPNGGGNLTEKTLTGEFWAIADGGTSLICGIEASYG